MPFARCARFIRLVSVWYEYHGSAPPPVHVPRKVRARTPNFEHCSPPPAVLPDCIAAGDAWGDEPHARCRPYVVRARRRAPCAESRSARRVNETRARKKTFAFPRNEKGDFSAAVPKVWSSRYFSRDAVQVVARSYRAIGQSSCFFKFKASVGSYHQPAQTSANQPPWHSSFGNRI